MNIILSENEKLGIDIIFGAQHIETGDYKNSYVFWQKMKLFADEALISLEELRDSQCGTCKEFIDNCECSKFDK